MSDCFEEFCRQELADENWLFWKGVEDFKSAENNLARRKELFEALYSKYIDEGSHTEMNVSGM
tara:strand:- start:153 stop:341 length:189 start_codon:yes stop_codon:yes gene_type:complete